MRRSAESGASSLRMFVPFVPFVVPLGNGVAIFEVSLVRVCEAAGRSALVSPEDMFGSDADEGCDKLAMLDELSLSFL